MTTNQKERHSGSNVAEAAKDTTNKAGDMLKDAASTVGQKATEAGSYVAHKAEDATCAVGNEMKSWAGTIREKGPHDGMLGNASSAVANTLESCGNELEHGLSGIGEDLTNTVRRHPVPSLLIGVGVGFLLARMCAR